MNKTLVHQARLNAIALHQLRKRFYTATAFMLGDNAAYAAHLEADRLDECQALYERETGLSGP